MTAYTLTSYDPVHVVLPKPPIPVNMLEDEVNRALEDAAEYERVEEDRPVQASDYLIITIAGSKLDGNPFDAFDGPRKLYHMGIGDMPYDFDKNLEGMHRGDTRGFSVKMASKLAAEGETSVIEGSVTVDDILTCTLPKLTDDLVKEKFPPMQTAQEFRGSIAAQFKHSDMPKDNPRFRQLMADEIGKRLVEDPDDNALRRNGGNKHAARVDCALQAIADHYGLDVSEEEAVDSVPGDTDAEKRATYGLYVKNGHKDDIFAAARQRKAIGWLYGNGRVSYE